MEPMPNLLRVLIGEPNGAGQIDSVVELSANIDDCTGEMLGNAIETLLQSGCLDAWTCPIFMKKSRPAWMLSAICAPSDVQHVEQIIFRETTTLGIRKRLMTRTKLNRRFTTVETTYGPIRIKLAFLGSEIITVSPEFSDCQLAAQSHNVSPREVLESAMTAYHQENQRHE